jgi:para-nitrobenzyl esterase
MQLASSAAPRTYHEDCLVLNVWTPRADRTARLPVLVWIHGGGYFRGSGESPWTNGARLSRRCDVVVVTVNHRLGVLGYLHLADLGSGDYGVAGNVGNLDLVAALQWVRDSIEAFGGDQRRVLIFGCSGGGCKSLNLMAMPAARGLFHRVAVQSGPAPLALTREVATELTERLLHQLQLPAEQLDSLQDLPLGQLFDAVSKARIGATREPQELPDHGFAPVVDGTTLPAHSLDAISGGAAADVPLLIGWNREEVLAFEWMLRGIEGVGPRELRERLAVPLGEHAERIVAIYEHAHPDASPRELVVTIMTGCMFRIPSLRLAEAKLAARSRTPTFVYEFGWASPDDSLRPVHTMEVPFVFGNLGVFPPAAVADGDALAARMGSAWAGFAADGVPGSPDSQPWPEYTLEERGSMRFDVDPGVEWNAHADERHAWDGVPITRLGSGRMIAPPPRRRELANPASAEPDRECIESA